jgi:hypothetical protein
MITVKEIKDWIERLGDDALIGVEDDMLIARGLESEGWESELVVGELPAVDDIEDEKGGEALYEVPVVETRFYKRTYTVRARSSREAQEKAADGDTEEESEGTLQEISERAVVGIPELKD